jgi:single-stranded-DNA-specific exonuclease
MFVGIPDVLEKVLEVDVLVDIKKVNKKLIEDLQKFEPFGFGNPRPIFASDNLIISDIRTVGEGKHLKFKVTKGHPERSEGSIDCIAFKMGELAKDLQNGQLISLAYSPELNTYNGLEKIQLKVKDLKLST